MNKIFKKLSNLPKNLKYFGDVELRLKSQSVPEYKMGSIDIKKEINRCFSSLKEIRKKTGLGVALAAPQIGIKKRIIVAYLNGEFSVFINPKIIKKSKSKGIYKEMCLSGMPLAADVIRPWTVQVEYSDNNGIIHKEKLNHQLSRMFQHEIDHLNGVLFIDKAKKGTFIFVDDFLKYKSETKLIKLNVAK